MASAEEKTEGIKEILASEPGKRLISYMALVQPITARELQCFPSFSLDFFNSFLKKEQDGNVANTTRLNSNLKVFKNVAFDNKELYGKDRILKRALRNGLVFEVPSKKGEKKDKYYFLNSDLSIVIGKGGVGVVESETAFPLIYRYNSSKEALALNANPNYRKIIREKITKHDSKVGEDPRLFSLYDIFSLFWWMKNHPDLMVETMNLFYSRVNVRRRELPLGWRKSYLFNKALDENVLEHRGEKVSLSTKFFLLNLTSFTLIFTPSYSILSCFSNYKSHLREANKKCFSRGKLLDVLTSEEYRIDPLKRPKCFSSFFYVCHGFRSVRNTEIFEDEIFRPLGSLYGYIKPYIPRVKKEPLMLETETEEFKRLEKKVGERMKHYKLNR